MWLIFALVAALVLPLIVSFNQFFTNEIKVSSQIYVRPLPAKTTFDGVFGRAIIIADIFGNSTTSESVVKCVEAWEATLPKALVFNEKTKKCTPLLRVYGTTAAPADERGFRIDESDKDVCKKGAMDDLNEILDQRKCRAGWTELSFRSTTACYIIASGSDFGRYDRAVDRFKACQDIYSSKVASIHSQEENDALTFAFRMRSLTEIGLIGDPLKPTDVSALKWLDGTPVDYTNFHGGRPTSSGVWYQLEPNRENGKWVQTGGLIAILCKYIPDT